MKIHFKGFNNPKVIDENGREVIKFKKVIALPTRERYDVINDNNEKVGYIERIRYNFGLVDLPTVVVSINDEKFKIEKDMRELKEFIEFKGSEVSITGNIYGPHFNILQGEKIIASVDVKQEEFKYSYLVDISDTSNTAKIISILFVLSWIA